MTPPTPHAQTGRLARGPFALGVFGVYFAILASQMLLSMPETGSLRVVPFVLLQAVLIWPWYVLHVRRLRDAARPTGIVKGMAVVLAMETVLLVTTLLF